MMPAGASVRELQPANDVPCEIMILTSPAIGTPCPEFFYGKHSDLENFFARFFCADDFLRLKFFASFFRCVIFLPEISESYFFTVQPVFSIICPRIFIRLPENELTKIPDAACYYRIILPDRHSCRDRALPIRSPATRRRPAEGSPITK